MATPDFEKIIDGLTLEQKIGQMYMGGVAGGETLDFARHNYEKYHFGALQYSGVFERFIRGGDYLPCGVCRNFPLDEVAEFLFRVKELGRELTGLPVIMAGDQEGSISNSIFRRRNVALMPSALGLGACGDPANAYQSARVSAREAKTIGLDMLYGPSLDVLTNPANPEIGSRSFSGDPEMVARLGEQFIRAYAAENVISNVKHFPGRGHGQGDAHRDLEAIELSRADLERLALRPFRRAVAAGVDSFMVAHTLYPALETERLPASLSPRIMTDLLRHEMGFAGVIMPDEQTMFAIAKNFPLVEAPAMCLAAGADLVFMKVPELYAASIAMIQRYLRDGKLTEDRINQSVRRILQLKFKRGLFETRQFSKERVLATVGCAEHVAVARRAAAQAVVVVKNRQQTLPLKLDATKSLLAIVPRDMHVVLANDPNLSHDMLPRSLQRHYANVEHVIVDESPTKYQAYEALGRAKNVAAVVFGIYSAGASAAYLEMVQSVVELKKPAIAVLTNSPYPATLLPAEIGAVVCALGLTPFAFEATADVIAGQTTATAKLPIPLTVG